MKNKIVGGLAFILGLLLMLFLPIVGHAEGYEDDVELAKELGGIFFSILGMVCIIAMLIVFFVLKNSKRKRAIACGMCLNIAEAVFAVAVIGFDYSLSSIVYVMYVFSIMLLFIEYYEAKAKVLDRIILYGIEALTMLITFITAKTGSDPSNLSGVMVSCLVFSSIIAIYQLVLLILVCRKKENVENKQTQSGAIPTGYTSGKSFIIIVIFLVVVMVCAIVGIMLTEKLWVKIVIGVALFIVILVFIFAKALLVDRKIFTDYSKTLDYDKFEHDILKIINKPNLDRETVNFYKMQYAAIALSYSYDKYQEIIKEVFEPTNRAYLPSYYTLGINITMPYEEFIPAIEEAKRKCGAAYSKRIDSIKELWTAYYTGESNKDINLLAPRDEKKKSRDAMSLFVQIFYYLHNDDKHKAVELKNEFMAKYSRLNTLVDIIEKSFNHSEEEL